MKLTRILTRMAAAALSGAAVFSLTGCGVSALDVDNYMRPPAASGYSAGIQQAMTEAIGSQYTLRYPRSGEYRSAVVMADIDSDENDEAIVFYRLSTESIGAHMAVLDSTADEDEWTVVGEVRNNGGEIDRILLCDINGDGNRELVSGWTGIAEAGLMSVHCMTDGALQSIDVVSKDGELPLNEYSEMVVGDFDSDMCEEVMTVCRSTAEGTAVARMLKLGYGSDGAMQLVSAGSIGLDGSVYKYENVQAGNITEDIFGMVLDGCRGSGVYTTEAVFWDSSEKKLAAPINVGAASSARYTRSLPTVSRDIDGDGVVEIPCDRLMPGYSANDAEQMFLTQWYKLNRSGNANVLFQAVMRGDQGYYFVYPESWRERVTGQPDGTTRTMFFFLNTPGAQFSSELFRIKIFTLDEWEKRERHIAADATGETVLEYFKLAETDYYIYAVLVMPIAEKYDIDEDVIMEQFHLDS